MQKKTNSVIVEYHYKYPYVNNNIINKNFTFFFISCVEVSLVLEIQELFILCIILVLSLLCLTPLMFLLP